MVHAKLIHVETGVEYYKDGSIYFPSYQEKLLWAVCGLPEGVERLEETFETEIDEFNGRTKKEIKQRVDVNFVNGDYKFLPALGFNQTVELRFF